MAKNENQKLKLFRVLEFLMERTDDETGVSMAEIISHLESRGISAERKSIYDDLRLIDELGFEVIKLEGKPTRYTLGERIFEFAELKMLVDAIQSSKFITAKQTENIIKKLKSFAGARHSGELARQVYVEDRVKTVNKAALYSIDCIHNAINGNRRISFAYFDYNSEKQKVLRHGGERYSVTPKTLMWNDENYYLVGYDEGAGQIKNFRVDKMQNTELCSEPPSEQARKVSINPADYSQKIFGMYGGEESLVTIEFAERLCGAVIDRFGTSPTFTKTKEGVKASVKVMLSPTFFAWVFSFGRDMRIISPESVRERYVGLLRECAEKNK